MTEPNAEPTPTIVDAANAASGSGVEPPYQRLTPTMMVQLAAPHTWPASIFPVLLAMALACGAHKAADAPAIAGFTGAAGVDGVSVLVLLAISVLFQSAVNTVNDYFDFAKGTDTAQNQDDPADAVLVYNHVDPRHVLVFIACLVAAAFGLGVYCIAIAGWVPLAIALVGVAVVFLYSGSRTPISYLPLGEVVSGFVMGGLITLASYQVLTLRLDWAVLLYALPVMLGIALIMMTNNGCDIQKDEAAGRRTLPVLLGHERTLRAYHGIVYAWMAVTCALVVCRFTAGWVVLPFMLLAVHPLGRALLANPLAPETRGTAFAQVTAMNIAMGAFYCAAVLASGL